MDFDQKSDPDHIEDVAYCQHEYFVGYLHVDNCNQLLFADYVALM